VIDAFGAPQSVAVLGGTSEIGLALVRALDGRGRLRRVVLAGRDEVGLKEAARDLASPAEGPGPAHQVRTVHLEAEETASHDEVVSEVFADGDLDVVVLAVGVLGAQDGLLDDAAAAVRLVEVNYVAGVSLGLAVTRRLREQGHGVFVVLSSVAGERGRAANFVYGSSKAGLDTFAQGLGDRLHGTGVRVLVVRPGFVRTRMTAGRPESPLACGPDDVARAVVRAIRTGRETVWVPSTLRPVMAGLRLLPRRVFRALPL
jgi:decaprenylphospho-beta-D-erythro-pentofuranosid-2-ulose 2-reductase